MSHAFTARLASLALAAVMTIGTLTSVTAIASAEHRLAGDQAELVARSDTPAAARA